MEIALSKQKVHGGRIYPVVGGAEEEGGGALVYGCMVSHTGQAEG